MVPTGSKRHVNIASSPSLWLLSILACPRTADGVAHLITSRHSFSRAASMPPYPLRPQAHWNHCFRHLTDFGHHGFFPRHPSLRVR